MGSKSQHVKDWRKRTKKRMIAAMGGKCATCGYDKCSEAMDFHHLDPNKKDFGLGAARGSPAAWSKIVDELRKCVMLCAICHREYHAGERELPEDLPGFDEQYASYEIQRPERQTQPCPVCGQPKSPVFITCSRKCAGKRTFGIDWDMHDLVEMKKTMTNVQIAEVVGCSDVAISKRLKKIMNR